MLAAILNHNLATAEFTGSYIRSGPIRREVNVRPPRNFDLNWGIVWKLFNIPYGMADAGRQRLLRVEYWMLRTAGMSSGEGDDQVFVNGGEIELIVAKVIDDLLIAGNM